MRKVAVVLLIAGAFLLNCSEDSTGPEETISRPDTPTGEDSPNVGETKTYKTGGATSNLGHAVQYRFDLDAAGARDYTAWSAFDTVAASWPDSALYTVKAQARCAEHNGAVSPWSEEKLVGVAVEFVTPGAIGGSEFPWPDSLETYCAVGAVSNKGHQLEYQFDFDAAGSSDTTVWDTTSCVEHTWPSVGSYDVKVRARCSIHNEVVSTWSQAKTAVVALESITGPGTPTGDTETYTWQPLTLCAPGAASNKLHALEYQFEFYGLEVGDTTVWNLADSTAWDTSMCATKTWPSIRSYSVRARARCATHTYVVTQWSGSETIAVDVEQIPEIRFATYIRDAWQPYAHADVPTDTVGVLEPFIISYHGITVNGGIRSYKYFPLSPPGVVVEGSNVWYNDLADTIRTFTNFGDELIPSGVLKFAAMCRDDAWAESFVDPASYRKGVCQIVVNYDPDTRIHGVNNSYTIDDVVYEETVNFQDGIPDTVPYDSWARIRYSGQDDARDGKIDCTPIEPDKCIGFQVAYRKDSDRVPGAFEFSLWQPRDGTHDTDLFTSTDTNTFHIGSLEYDLMARAVDEHGRPDGTPPSVSLVGNYDPVLDSVAVEDHFGNRIDLSTLDTVTWNFWKGEGWPYVCLCDTVDAPPLTFCNPGDCGGRTYPDNGDTYDFYKVFSVHVKAWGHDHPKDPTGSGVQSWQYYIKDNQDQFVNLGKSTVGWFDGAQIDVMDDVIRWKVRYPGPFSPNPDPTGDTVFDNLPTWMDQDLTFYLMGRDTKRFGSEFEQTIFINGVEQIINVFPDGQLGRWTEERVFAFRIQLVR